ncbi:MAG TPA: MBL fold metallo-hydrolase [Steroidobacteraceae bacterium]|nr:MBL fold metallo-hydrolase [Steroidobacteraceae bacterium]
MQVNAKWRAFAFVILGMIASLPTRSQDFDKEDIRTSPLRANLYLLQGIGGNIVVSVGAVGTLIVDDEYRELNAKLVAAIRKITDCPVQFVINTHWHNDHTGGNEILGKAGAIVIAHENAGKRMTMDSVMSLYGPQAAYAPAGQAQVTYSVSMQLHRNGETIDLLHPGPAHTDGDTVVYFREHNILMTGDIFVGFEYRPPYFDDLNGGSLKGMISGAETILGLIDDKTVVIPGHGEVATRADLVAYRAGLIDIRERIRAAVARGESEDAVVASKPVGGFARAGKGTDRWVRVVYREYQQAPPARRK